MGSSPSHRASMKRRAGSRQRLSSIANNYIVVEIDGKHAVVTESDLETQVVKRGQQPFKVIKALVRNDTVSSRFSQAELKCLVGGFEKECKERGGRFSLTREGVQHMLGVDDATAERLFTLLDSNGDSTCTLQEFLKGFSTWRDMCSSGADLLIVTFKLFDVDGSGTLSRSEFANMLKSTCLPRTPASGGDTRAQAAALFAAQQGLGGPAGTISRVLFAAWLRGEDGDSGDIRRRHPGLEEGHSVEDVLATFDAYSASEDRLVTEDEVQVASSEDPRLTEDEVAQVLHSHSSSIGNQQEAHDVIERRSSTVMELTERIFDEIDTDSSGEIELAEFKVWAEANEEAVELINKLRMEAHKLLVRNVGCSADVVVKKNGRFKSAVLNVVSRMRLYAD